MIKNFYLALVQQTVDSSTDRASFLEYCYRVEIGTSCLVVDAETDKRIDDCVGVEAISVSNDIY